MATGGDGREEETALSLRISSLRCEHREDLPMVGSEAPRFGWALAASGRDRRQTAYRILVGADAKELEREAASFWDSGKVLSSRTLEVFYAGKPLPPASELVWTVQVFDEEGRPSAWAEPARFRTGLEAWRASWIFHDREGKFGLTVEPGERLRRRREPGVDLEGIQSQMEPATYLRREFTLSQSARRATLYATARGLLDLELNGRRVGDATLAPGWTDYARRIEYSAHDVTDLLRGGENALGASLGDGWFAGFVGSDKKRGGAIYGRVPELLCELHLELEDGRTEIVCSDERWRATNRGPIRHADLLRGERHDARLSLDGWSEPGFDDDGWGAVKVKPLDEAMLVPAKGQPIRVTEERRPLSVVEQRPGIHQFDLGQNMVGRARLVTEGPEGTEVKLSFGEVLDEDGALYRDNLLTASQIDTFVLRGEGAEVFEPRFTSHGFRYVEVEGLALDPDEETLTGCVVHSDAPLTSEFSCSSEMVNQIFSNSVWTQRGNYVSVPTDCPQRDERLGWAGDAQIYLPTAALIMDVAAFMTKWADDIADGQSDEGAYPDVAPRASWMNDGAPGWGDAAIVVPWVVYNRYGDLGIVGRHWPRMERFMAYVGEKNPDFLRRHRRNGDFGDWLSIGERVPSEVLATAYWSRSARLMARMAEALELPGRAAHYDRLADDVAAAFVDAYLSEDSLIEGDTQTGYVLALAWDLLPEELRPRAAGRLVENIERRDWHLATGIIGTHLLCPVLTKAGHADVAHRLLEQDTMPSWGHMVRFGATTMWENWDGITEDGFRTPLQNSLNHCDWAVVASWLIESVAGIRCADGHVAYERVVIEPVPGNLDAARASYRSVRGEIVSDWQREEGRFRLAVTIPPNVTATVVVPAHGETLLQGGNDAAGAAGVRSALRDGDSWVVEVGSGAYELESA